MSAGDPAFELRLKAIFDEFDDDGGGEIDTEELGQVMEKLGQHCTEAELHVGARPPERPRARPRPPPRPRAGRPLPCTGARAGPAAVCPGPTLA